MFNRKLQDREKAMKRIYQIILSSTLLLSCGGFLVSCSDDTENEIENTVTIDSLPAAARQFLNKYFEGEKISKIEEEIDGNVTVYVVNLENGFEVVFNSEGEWTQVVAPDYKTVPSGIIPETVTEALSANNYSSYGIKQINTTGEGWKVELSNNLNNEPGGAGIDIWINQSGEITNVSQEDV